MPAPSARRVLRVAWRIFFYGVVLSFVVLVLSCILFSPFGSVEKEFTDLSGSKAHEQLQGRWLEQVDPAEVQTMSYKYASTIDSHSTWFRIQLSPKAASNWSDAAHGQAEETYDGRLNSGESVEGVHRTVAGPPPLHRHTGTVPAWWSPPSIDFRATELMKWYREHQSGIGRATYSGFDENTGTLWVYEYSAQHDLLWSEGNLPAGTSFEINRSPRQVEEPKDPIIDETTDVAK